MCRNGANLYWCIQIEDNYLINCEFQNCIECLGRSDEEGYLGADKPFWTIIEIKLLLLQTYQSGVPFWTWYYFMAYLLHEKDCALNYKMNATFNILTRLIYFILYIYRFYSDLKKTHCKISGVIFIALLGL
jgi:hypothetical protein